MTISNNKGCAQGSCPVDLNPDCTYYPNMSFRTYGMC